MLTAKERQKRDRALRRGKENEGACNVEKIANLSLSDSDTSNRKRVILGEAEKTLEMGKKLGLRARGDERDVLEEIMNLDGQQQ